MGKRSLQPKLLLCISLPIIATIIVIIAVTVASMYLLAEKWVDDSISELSNNLQNQLLIFSNIQKHNTQSRYQNTVNSVLMV